MILPERGGAQITHVPDIIVVYEVGAGVVLITKILGIITVVQK